MSKATRNRARTARERIAAQQAEARKAEQRRRLLIVGGSVGLVIVIVVAFIVVKGLAKPASPGGSGALPAAVTHNITNVPASTLGTIGTGKLPPSGLPVKPITDTALTSANKPEMLYIGAEFCPYCAAMRWSMAVALSKFGTFGPLKGIHSSSTDVFPNTPSLTFRNQQYSSPYLTFTPVEHQKVNSQPLQPVSQGAAGAVEQVRHERAEPGRLPVHRLRQQDGYHGSALLHLRCCTVSPGHRSPASSRTRTTR